MSERIIRKPGNARIASTALDKRRPWHFARGIWDRHSDILRNALSLLATSGVTSAIGFAYWDLAARLFTQQSVGYSAAAISVMSLLSWLGIFGFATLLIGELPRRRNKVGLISAAVLASGFGSLILTVGFVLIVPRFTSSFNDVTDTPARAGLLCCAVALTAMTLVFDSATIGLLRGGIQLTRNISFVIIKMFTLVIAATILRNALGLGIFLSWVAAIPISVIPVAIQLWRTGKFVLPRPDWAGLRSLARAVVAHNWLNLAIQVPSLLMPVIAAAILRASVNAGFYAAWTIVNLLYFLPTHLSTVLFAVAAGDRRALAAKLRFTLSASVLLGLPGMAVLGLGAYFILGIFGKGYAQVAAVPMQLLVLGYLPTIPKLYYVAVCRATGRLSRAAALETSFAALEIVGAVIGCLRAGPIGLVVALLAVGTVEAVVTLPAVLRAAWVGGRHRHGPQLAGLAAEAQAPENESRALEKQRADEVRQRARQRAALAVLMSLAVPAQSVVGPFEEQRSDPSG